MNTLPFLWVGITDGSPQSQDITTLTTLLTRGLDYLYWRTPADTASPNQLPTHLQASVLLPAGELDNVPPPFRWHLKESDRLRLPDVDSPCFSTSIHYLDAWPLLAGRTEMVFYSPVFASISKPGYGPTVSLDTVGRQMQAIRQQHARLPLLIGLGGVTANNVVLLQQAGFDGAALMGSLWQTPDACVALAAIRGALKPEAP